MLKFTRKFQIQFAIFFFLFGIQIHRSSGLPETNSFERNFLDVSNSVDDSYEILRQFRQEEVEYENEPESSTKQPSNETAFNLLFKQVLPAVNGLFKQFSGEKNESIFISAVKEFQNVGAEIVKPFTNIEIPVAGAVKEVNGIVKQLTKEGGLVTGVVKEFQQLFGAILDEFEPKPSTATSKAFPPDSQSGSTSPPGKRYPDIVENAAYGEIEVTVPPTTAAAYAESEPTMRTVRTTRITSTITTERYHPPIHTEQQNRYKLRTTPNPFLNQQQLHEAVIPSKIIPSRIRTTPKPSLIDYEDKEEDEDSGITLEPSKLAEFLSKYQYNKFNNLQEQQTIAPGTISKDSQFPTTKPHDSANNEILDLLHSVSSSFKTEEKLIM